MRKKNGGKWTEENGEKADKTKWPIILSGFSR